MIEVALPLSHLVEADLGLAADLLATADWAEYKFPRPMDLPPGLRRTFHWGKGFVESDFQEAVAAIFDFLSEQRVESFSFDLGPAGERSQFVLPLSETLSEAGIFALAERRLRLVREHFKGRLAVENYNYYPTGLYEHICEPEFIGRFVAEFDLDFVLDLAHAEVSAANLGRELWVYLEEMPLDRVVEVHLSRPYFHPRIAVDAHLAPEAEDFVLLDELLHWLPGRDDPPLVAIEYFGEVEGLRRSFKELIVRRDGPPGAA
ncbi:MAG: DUF692 family protein [Proteobacteria bacterium]|nr:DUF692 family protein [Pseudomonadota bacterium]